MVQKSSGYTGTNRLEGDHGMGLGRLSPGLAHNFPGGSSHPLDGLQTLPPRKQMVSNHKYASPNREWITANSNTGHRHSITNNRTLVHKPRDGDENGEWDESKNKCINYQTNINRFPLHCPNNDYYYFPSVSPSPFTTNVTNNKTYKIIGSTVASSHMDGLSSASDGNARDLQINQFSIENRNRGSWKTVLWSEMEKEEARAQNFPTSNNDVMDSKGLESQKDGTNTCDDKEEQWKTMDKIPPEDKSKRRKVDKCKLGYNFQNFSHLSQINTCNSSAGTNIFTYEQIPRQTRSHQAHMHRK